MPFVIFEDKEMYRKAFSLEIKNTYNQLEERIEDGPITCLHGKGKELHMAVFIYPENFLDAFDKKGIKYKIVSEKEAEQYLSKGGKEYLENLKKVHPEFIV